MQALTGRGAWHYWLNGEPLEESPWQGPHPTAREAMRAANLARAGGAT